LDREHFEGLLVGAPVYHQALLGLEVAELETGDNAAGAVD
jgi:hypothetical protein